MTGMHESYSNSLPERVARLEERTAALVRGVVASRESKTVSDAATNARITASEQRLAEIGITISDHGYQIKMVWQSVADGRASLLSSIGDIRERIKTLEVNSGVLKRLEWLPIAGLGYALVTHTPLADVLKLIK